MSDKQTNTHANTLKI